jgi:sialate O-acetylesterase
MKKIFSALFALAICFSFHLATAAIKLPKLISDGMVLQRDKNIIVWGWASPGEKVSVAFNGASYTANTSNLGKWQTTIAPQQAGGPYTMKIKGTNEIEVRDILIGEVWICSGQSNMGFKMEKAKERYAKEIQESTNSNIRQFCIDEKLSAKKLDDVVSTIGWKSADPQTVLRFTAAGYFFAKKLYEQYHVPIGIVMTAFGGTPVDGWTSEEGLKDFPAYVKKIEHYKDPAVLNAAKAEDKKMVKAWYASIASRDISATGKRWTDDDYNSADWKTLTLPGYWEHEGISKEARLVYFKKELTLPATKAGKQATLYLGNIKGEDSTYVNGIKVGFTANINSTRIYTVPAGILKAGKNIISTRVLNMDGSGGFVTDKPYKLQIGTNTYPLSGEWKYKAAANGEIINTELEFKEKDIPSLLFNAMISPILNYSFRGVIWYQGEHDINKGYIYRKLFPALINDWRKQFNQGDFPFLFAQLPAYNYGVVDKDPSESAIAELREAQAMALSIPNTGMIVTLDIGEYNDIHPMNKLDVGIRFALLARSMVYHEKGLVFSGPTLQSTKAEGNKMVLNFGNTGSGLTIRNGGELKTFAIAGADKKYYWAKAQIQGDKILVWSDDVPNPVAVRYGWVNDSAHANLSNKEGLPAAPFRTDQWTNITKNRL